MAWNFFASSLSFPFDGCRIGFVDYNDLATSSTPISIPSGLIDTPLTNDEAGPFTNKSFLPSGVTDIWDSGINLFDFSQLKLGDMIDLRLDLEFTTTSPNQILEVDLIAGIGGNQYSIPFIRNQFKNTGSETVNRFSGIYMGDNNTKDNGARFVVRSDSPATIKVGGWYCKILTRGYS